MFKSFSSDNFSILLKASNHQIADKKNSAEFAFNLQYLNSNFTLTLGYLNPALNKKRLCGRLNCTRPRKKRKKNLCSPVSFRVLALGKDNWTFLGMLGGGVMGDFKKIYPAHRKKNLSWSTNLEIKILHRCMSRKKFFHQRFGKKFLPKPNHAYPPSTVELMVISLTIFARPDTNTIKT